MNKSQMRLITSLVSKAYILFPVDCERYDLAIQIGRAMDGPENWRVCYPLFLPDDRIVSFFWQAVVRIRELTEKGPSIGDSSFQYVLWAFGIISWPPKWHNCIAALSEDEEFLRLLDELRIRLWEGAPQTLLST